MGDILKSILENNAFGVFTFFILGILVIVFIQNIFFYYNYKDKAYLWYAIYAFIIILDQLFISYMPYYRSTNDTPFIISNSIHVSLEWLYNSAYIIFVIEFGDLYLLGRRTANKIKNIVYGLAIILIVLFVADAFSQMYLVRKGFVYLQVPIMIILSVVIYFHLFKMKNKIKYYIIPGSLAFSIFSIMALGNSVIFKGDTNLSWGLFYIGVFIENVFFTLGLVVKQKVVLKERNSSQQELILQLRENEELKNKLTAKLQEEVSKKTSEIFSLNKKAETEKIKQIEIAFEKEIAELKISALQSQMNPHFIFNSLNSIKLYIIKNNKEKAVYYLNKFSKLIRKILSASREKVVSLQEELDTVELYVNIENIRFKNEINFSLSVEDNLNLATVKIPPLILQPFIENAIWHGLSSKKGSKVLIVEVLKKDKYFLEITIIDNGIGRKKSNEIKESKMHKKASLGLKLTEERLSNFSSSLSNKHQITLIDLKHNGEPVGTKVVILLPIK